MTDTYDAEVRSRTMRQVRSTNTSPELVVRKALHAAGFRFRLHRKDLPGKPDIVLPRYRLAVFVHGCFWHGHSCNRAKMPATNTEYWQRKRARNMERDQRNSKMLEEAGWQVRVIWGCQLRQETEVLLKDLQAKRTPAPAQGGPEP